MLDRKAERRAGDPYPGYDVLAKWRSPSWNDKTRQVVAARLRVADEPRFFTREEFETLAAVADRVVPQPSSRSPIPVAALLDRKLDDGVMDGYRTAGLPRDDEAWRTGLKALDAEARARYVNRFTEIDDPEQDSLLRFCEAGELKSPEWAGMPSRTFFKHRLLRDIVLAYYAHPISWSEIGWGGPASPRGYVRLDFNDRDPWEAAEAKPGREADALRVNRNVR
ncbi:MULTISPECIES: gluconate 2-dehydrogenase subunit 3 family protein [unclassified Bradyrhizobium]|uniref:gluconate 2-dehydrogenase subunit 3 family protein n=1 Tax=unclassified Bradyrhizobium TaxID=2631580 RepID=UPI001FF8C171|nr:MULTISPECIES: gluconate 2-dehydrogenase subunit 3 family protein [unclassified Bradyrhizobium]MCK1304378.1 gluconate 2-dehydrogenase subunit 3 family protein [Bradyrhizobium sp. 45]MCK1317318.1 gluconate 2-dehydrogenase subunit 3 family protein [Bradyrhizobium sp. 23]MCK1435428.1 gluconate 2-dehydrogenase subunit 3 family protein [Bradyrhizobium sp. 15]MCK1451962.1 gluconate 2-dehydrogenase subunit 3 family protein [Bradyrhizobium sp. 35]MCK1614870.1 gluconate 2-dehydrogenase subunit 3 fami